VHAQARLLLRAQRPFAGRSAEISIGSGGRGCRSSTAQSAHEFVLVRHRLLPGAYASSMRIARELYLTLLFATQTPLVSVWWPQVPHRTRKRVLLDLGVWSCSRFTRRYCGNRRCFLLLRWSEMLQFSGFLDVVPRPTRSSPPQGSRRTSVSFHLKPSFDPRQPWIHTRGVPFHPPPFRPPLPSGAFV